MKILLTWVLASGVHLVLQFIAWSYSSGNTATITDNQNFLQRVVWPIFSFPTFWLLSEPLTTEFFWITLVINSAIWGGVFVGLVTYLSGQQISFRRRK